MASTLQASDLSDIQLFDVPTLIDPWEAYARLREHAPVYEVAGFGLHVVTRYDLIRQVIKDTETFSSKFDTVLNLSRDMAFQSASKAVQDELMRLNGEMILIPPTMLTLDEPDHTKYRSLVSKLFTASRIRDAEDAVQAVVDETLASFIGASRVDFMQAFAYPVPLRIIADRLGIPEADRELFNEGATAAAAGLRLTPLEPDEMVHRAQLGVDLQNLLVRIIEDCRIDPKEDMISILANTNLEEEDRPLTHGESLSILNQFLVAGHETTTSTFGWGMLLLCENPEAQKALRADPSLTKTFVEEALRLQAPVQGLPRVVTRDTELGGVQLKAGASIMIRYGAGNRDERQFENPDELDLHRKKAGMQLAFGSGVHHCIGAPLARQELNLGFPALLRRMDNIRLAPGHAPPAAEPSFILRNLPELHIDYEILAG
ncbi:MAG: cytochrome P450 [Pseudomonadales bacterium]